jgi:hypothetical protein
MSTYPTSPRSAFLEWCQAHENVFVDNAAAIGLTVPQANAFKSATDAAAAATLAQEQAKQAAKVATQTVEDAFNTLRTNAGDTVRTIRAFAENSGKPLTAYNTAQIPPPAPPSPAPPPAQPGDLSVLLDPPTGALTLRWKASNPAGTSGTSYIIKRRVPGESEFRFLGVSGKKEFVDDTLVAGPDSVQYTVQGQRADSSGPVSPVFTVNFGRLPDGAMTASVSSADAMSAASDRAVVDAIINSKAHGNGRRATSRV